jgi:hypothetical protein
MAAAETVSTGAVDRRPRRLRRRVIAGVALVAVGAGACGAASALEPPLALSRAASSTLDDSGAVTISLEGNDPEDPQVAELLSHLALKVDWSDSGQAVRVLVDGTAGAEVVVDDTQFCARVDIEAFSPVAGWGPGEAAAMRDEAIAGIAEQLGGPMGADVERLAMGEWGCLSLADLQELQDSLPQDAVPAVDPALVGQLTAALTEAADGLVDPWSVREQGEDDELGRHLVAGVDAPELAQAIAGFVDVLQDELTEAGVFDQLGDVAGMTGVDEVAGEDLATGRWSDAVTEALANARGEVAFDTWVDDGHLTRVRVDLIAVGEALSGEPVEPAGTAMVLTLDFDQDASLPDVGDAVDLGAFTALAGMAAAGMANGGF